ncbi:SidA/IucD/PvdA family monooxygenase [Micromonospora sp. NPDC126480]|uniref:lysine N(6)-hydroxylase/L-ornithine N(5)-oxygenase family protein n=1 Tax=Micromonospora sp. NPDC126480 TaxID=3155312 RepID=UPI00332854A0
MQSDEVTLLAVGAGPANLALAVALEELAPEVAADTLVVEQYDSVVWQRGMLLPWTQSQVSFLKDLVTLRNPRSEYSFVNYLHAVHRLDDFINLGSFTPYRLEISHYLAWVAEHLRQVRIDYGRRCVGVEPLRDEQGAVDRWSVSFADGSRVVCRALVLGAGRDAHIPAEFAGLARERVIHSTEYSWRVEDLDPSAAHRIVVVGGAQSAAEMLWATHERFPRATCTMVMRSIGLNCYESSKFTNELFYPSFVDKFHAARPEARDQLLREMHRTNYSGLAPATLDMLYREIYLQRLTDRQRIRMVTMSEVAEATMDGDEIVLTLADRRTGDSSELRCDIVMLGTGFVRGMPRFVQDLAASVDVGEVTVNRDYRMNLPPHVNAACYLQGVNEGTHGIADSLLSVLAARSEEIVTDLLTHLLGTTAERPAALAAR